MGKIWKTGWVPVCPERDYEFGLDSAGPWWRHARSNRPSVVGSLVMSVGTPWNTLYKRGWRIQKCCVL